MYKTKLQELCQKREWGLPKYFAMKDGPDHNPCFKSSVFVNAQSFVSPFPCKSSKQAQNDAAKLAFLHFTSPPPPPNSSISSEPTIQEAYNDHDTQSHDFSVKDEVKCEYKSQLQNYSQWRNFDLPLYSSTTEGPNHALRFKATVTVNSRTFEGPHGQFFTTLKEAENAAAKAALMSMVTEDSQEGDSGFYKNLLQELAQKEGLSIPLYKTINIGASHMPTFFSFVEVEGEKFYGKAGKSKKVAEVNAAKVAYTFLKEIAMSRTAELPSPMLLTEECLESASGLDLTTVVDMQHIIQQDDHFLSSPFIIHEENSAENNDKIQEVKLAEVIPSNLKIGSEDPILSDSVSSRSEPFPILFKEGSLSSPAVTHNDLSAFSISNSKMENATAPRSYLLCERVRVYSCYPNIVFPKGITVLPISDNKWIAVSLEFPNEQGY